MNSVRWEQMCPLGIAGTHTFIRIMFPGLVCTILFISIWPLLRNTGLSYLCMQHKICIDFDNLHSFSFFDSLAKAVN